MDFIDHCVILANQKQMKPLNASGENNSKRKKAGVERMIKHNLRIDMTPMVDLGFLLISFFVITTELSKPRAMKVFMPADGKATDVAESKTITFLTGANDKLFYYYGEEKDAGSKNPIIRTSWNEETGIGKILTDKQIQLDQTKGGRNELVVIIKPGKRSSYKNMVDVLDEMTIHRISRYAIVKPGVMCHPIEHPAHIQSPMTLPPDPTQFLAHGKAHITQTQRPTLPRAKKSQGTAHPPQLTEFQWSPP
jgi:biopolymer transport protein ExbD